MATRVLITGGSIAGPALACWLGQAGYEVTVLERAPAFRDGGQNIDVRGAGREALQRMGLEAAVKAQGTGERGLRFVDEANGTVAEFSQEALGPDGPTAELEILRGDLSRILVETSAPFAAYCYGDHVLAVDQDEDGVDVGFANGGRERFDLVVVAEGVGSGTRRLVFGEAARRTFLGLSMAYFTIPRGSTDGEFARWYSAPGGRSALVRPDRKGTTRVILTVRQDPAGWADLTQQGQKDAVAACFADAGWEVPRLVAGLMASEDFYFEDISQVRLDRWSRGRVVLLGDAAWSTGPISGKGTSLALIGATVLAGELGRTSDVAAAFDSFERIMRPRAEKAQDLPSLGPKILQPKTRIGLALQRVALGIAASPTVRTIAGKVFGAGSDDPPLPDYGSGDRAAA